LQQKKAKAYVLFDAKWLRFSNLIMGLQGIRQRISGLFWLFLWLFHLLTALWTMQWLDIF